MRYTPSAIGADVDELMILTNALESDGVPGGSLTVPLSGFGSDVGLVEVRPAATVLAGRAAEPRAERAARVEPEQPLRARPRSIRRAS
mgnify:CR=1 FL=1